MESSVDHDANVIAAAALHLADRVREAVEEAAGTTGAGASALTALLAWADGAHIDALAAGLRLSHSRTVRVVDGLERDGLARREPDPADGRRARVLLSAQGRTAARRALEARARVLEEVLGALPARQRASMATASSALLSRAATSREESRAICRLCDAIACGHADGRCPSTQGADAAQAAS